MNRAMARAPLNPARAPSLKQVSKIETLPPPVGGWNARDPLQQMEDTDAIALDNMIPGIGDVSLRKGFASFATGMSTFIESLMVYAPPSGSNKMFAAVPAAIYDVSAAGAVGAAAVSSLSNGRWQHTMFATTGGNYLVIANGADSVRNYDGSAWSTPSITNVTSSNLIGVAAHTQRLWFVEKDKLDPWYLPVAAIAGAASKLIVSPYCKLGGYLQAIGSWSRDGGSGAHDLLVLVTSEGEVVIYQGTDPDFTDFTQVGTYRIAKPIGRRCILKTGADLGILTDIGIVPLGKVLAVAISAQGHSAITDKIRNAFTQSAHTARTNFGWQVIESPIDRLAIVNVPTAERTTQVQYVMNSDTGAWCRFTGMNAGCWAIFNGKAYFGGNNGTVYLYGESFTDNGSTISAVLQQAYSNFEVAQNKRFLMAQPMFRGPASYVPAVEIKVDFDISATSLPASIATTDASLWNVSYWNVSYWGQGSTINKRWQTLNGIGQFGSIAISLSLASEFALNSTNVMFEPGGYF